MTTTTSEFRKHFSETFSKVQYNHERVVLERHGKPIAVLMPYEDFEFLEEMEDQKDIAEAEKILANIENETFYSSDEVKRMLGL